MRTLTDAGHDAVLLPQAGATTGGTQIGDLAVGQDGPVFASHRFSCLAPLARRSAVVHPGRHG